MEIDKEKFSGIEWKEVIASENLPHFQRIKIT